VPTRFLKSWIEAHYLDRVLTTFRAELPTLAGLTIVVRSAFRDPAGAVRASGSPTTGWT